MGRKYIKLWGTNIYGDDVEEDVDLTLTLGRSNSNLPRDILPLNPPTPYINQDRAENGPIATENRINREVNNISNVDLMIMMDNAMVIYDQSNASREADAEAEASTSSGGGHKRKNSFFNDWDKECEFCNKTINETPNWRRGPNGPNTLCNACGLRYAKASRDS